MKLHYAKKDRLDCILLLALAMALVLTPLLRFGQQCETLHSEVLRLHILANSDSETDQRIKLAVRDAVLEGTGALFGSAADLAEAESLTAQNLAHIEALAQAELLRQGASQQVRAELCNMYFGTRVYPTGTLPAGRYDALRLVIGEGAGKNWWCVMFPPLCVESATKETTPLEEKVENLDKRPDYKLAFASVELVESLREKLRESRTNP